MGSNVLGHLTLDSDVARRRAGPGAGLVTVTPRAELERCTYNASATAAIMN
jgi:hypothetical protein